MRNLNVVVVKNNDNNCDGERPLHGYDFQWPDGSAVSIGIDKFCQFGVRFLVGKKRQHHSHLEMTLLASSVDDPSQNYPKGRFRRFQIRSDGTLCFPNGIYTQVQFNEQDDPRVLEWLGWNCNDIWVDIGVRYDQVNHFPRSPGSVFV